MGSTFFLVWCATLGFSSAAASTGTGVAPTGPQATNGCQARPGTFPAWPKLFGGQSFEGSEYPCGTSFKEYTAWAGSSPFVEQRSDEWRYMEVPPMQTKLQSERTILPQLWGVLAGRCGVHTKLLPDQSGPGPVDRRPRWPMAGLAGEPSAASAVSEEAGQRQGNTSPWQGQGQGKEQGKGRRSRWLAATVAFFATPATAGNGSWPATGCSLLEPLEHGSRPPVTTWGTGPDTGGLASPYPRARRHPDAGRPQGLLQVAAQSSFGAGSSSARGGNQTRGCGRSAAPSQGLTVSRMGPVGPIAASPDDFSLGCTPPRHSVVDDWSFVSPFLAEFLGQRLQYEADVARIGICTLDLDPRSSDLEQEFDETCAVVYDEVYARRVRHCDRGDCAIASTFHSPFDRMGSLTTVVSDEVGAWIQRPSRTAIPSCLRCLPSEKNGVQLNISPSHKRKVSFDSQARVVLLPDTLSGGFPPTVSRPTGSDLRILNALSGTLACGGWPSPPTPYWPSCPDRPSLPDWGDQLDVCVQGHKSSYLVQVHPVAPQDMHMQSYVLLRTQSQPVQPLVVSTALSKPRCLPYFRSPIHHMQVGRPQAKPPSAIQRVVAEALPLVSGDIQGPLLYQPVKELVSVVDAPQGDDDALKFTVFDTIFHERARTRGAAWSIMDCLADAVSSAAARTKAAQLITIPMRALPQPQITLSYAGVGRTTFALPLDLRDYGFSIYTFEATPGDTVQDVFDQLANARSGRRPLLATGLNPGTLQFMDAKGHSMPRLLEPVTDHEWLRLVPLHVAGLDSATTTTCTHMQTFAPSLLGDYGMSTAVALPSVLADATLWPRSIGTPIGANVPLTRLNIYPGLGEGEGRQVPFTLFVHGYPPIRLQGAKTWSMLDYCRDAAMQLEATPISVQLVTQPILGLAVPQITMTESGLPREGIVLPLDMRDVHLDVMPMAIRPGTTMDAILDHAAEHTPELTAALADHRAHGRVFLQDCHGHVLDIIPDHPQALQWIAVRVGPRPLPTSLQATDHLSHVGQAVSTTSTSTTTTVPAAWAETVHDRDQLLTGSANSADVVCDCADPLPTTAPMAPADPPALLTKGCRAVHSKADTHIQVCLGDRSFCQSTWMILVFSTDPLVLSLGVLMRRNPIMPCSLSLTWKGTGLSNAEIEPILFPALCKQLSGQPPSESVVCRF